MTFLLVLIFGITLSTLADTPADLYTAATHHLRDGHWYEVAMAQLTAAAQQSPNDPAIPLALGCAEADRAASISYAYVFTHLLRDDQTQYAQAVKEWEKSQADPNDPNHSDPRPAPPPKLVFQTKDDLKSFRMTDEQAITRIAALGAAAVAEWSRSRTLAKTPTDQAEAAYTQSWGYVLLSTIWSNLDHAKIVAMAQEGSTLEVFDATMEQAPINAVKAMQDATKAMLGNAVYWQSLGDVLAHNTGSNAPIIAAYTKSLALQPNNTSLWYRLYAVQSNTPEGDQAFAALKKAAEGDPGNAYPQYLMAALLFRKTHYSDPFDKVTPGEKAKALAATYDAQSQKAAQEALTAIETGNSAFVYQSPIYRPPVPKLLAAAWKYTSNFIGPVQGFEQIAQLRELARACSGYAQIAAQQNNSADAARAEQDCIGLGAKLAGNWPIQDSSLEGHEILNTLVGIAIMGIGYKGLEQAYEKTGDTNMAQQAAADLATLNQWKKAYAQTMAASLSNSVYQSY